jgi:hypothetical protein
MKTFKTKAGTELGLINLKGKDYMQVASRLVWFVEETPMYHISVQFLSLDQEQAVAQTTIVILNDQGQAVRKTTATKRETKKDFFDFIEKAETGSLGRALAQLGYGTQFAQADLDEGARIVDAPLEAVNQSVDTKQAAPTETKSTVKVSSFRKKKTDTVEEAKDVTPAVKTTPANGSKSDEWM